MPLRLSGTSPLAMRWARPSTMAVLPTPGSPISTGLFLVRRHQHLQHPADLLVPADDRVQLAGPGHLREVPGELLQRGELLLGALVLHPGALARFADGRLQLLPVQAELRQQFLGIGGGVGEGQEHGVGGHEAVPQAARRCRWTVPGSSGRPAPPAAGCRRWPWAGRPAVRSAPSTSPSSASAASPARSSTGPQAHVRLQQGREQVLGQKFRMLAGHRLVPGAHKGFVRFLGKRQHGHGQPPQASIGFT